MLYKNPKIIEKTLALPLVNLKSRALTETFIAMLIAVIVPAILAHTPQNQFIVGPIVNAVLFWVAFRVGVTNALFIAVIPSLIALSRGMLPPTAAAAIPFIVLGNCAMILTFAFLKTQLWLRIIASAAVKTLVIFLPVLILLNLLSQISFMMSWPQLVTALVGGFIAITLSKKIGFSPK